MGLTLEQKLGIPTANIPIAGLSVGGHEEVESGVYYGFAGLDVDGEGRRVRGGGGMVWDMVMSIGWNPFYKNTVRSVVSLFPFFLCPTFAKLGNGDGSSCQEAYALFLVGSSAFPCTECARRFLEWTVHRRTIFEVTKTQIRKSTSSTPSLPTFTPRT